MKKTLLTLALALAAGSAQAIPLSDLLNGGSITAGDKLFSDWSEISFASSDPNRIVNTANIEVTALDDGGDDPGPGLAFNILNGEFDVTGDGIYAFLDYMFGFKVTVLDPRKQVKDNSLGLTFGFVTNVGDNGFYIRETIGTSAGADDLGVKGVEYSWLDPDGLIANLTDSAAFLPQDEIWVTKNILVWASGTDETASLQGFEQRFSQQQVPEPATLGLLALGLAGLGFSRLRRSA